MASLLPGSSTDPAEAHAEICRQLCALVPGAPASTRSWRLDVAPSELAEAGDGVFLRGSCEAGCVLAVYPGVTFATDDLPAMHKMILPGNNYVLMRRDGILIDGRPDGPSRQLFEAARQREVAAGAAPPLEGTALTVGNKGEWSSTDHGLTPPCMHRLIEMIDPLLTQSTIRRAARSRMSTCIPLTCGQVSILSCIRTSPWSTSVRPPKESRVSRLLCSSRAVHWPTKSSCWTTSFALRDRSNRGTRLSRQGSHINHETFLIR